MSSYQSRETFRFKECTLLPISTGIQARNLRELREGIEEVVPSCLYYHFWGRLLSPQFPESEYVNDFASWAKVYLHEDALSEKLSALDLNHRNDIEDIREELLDILDETLSSEYFISWKEADRTFHFTRAHLIVVEIALTADSPQTLPRAIASSSRGSVFFHFIEAKWRNREDRRDDYSKWLECFGEGTRKARDELAIFDPYLYSLSDLRERLVSILESTLTWKGESTS